MFLAFRACTGRMLFEHDRYRLSFAQRTAAPEQIKRGETVRDSVRQVKPPRLCQCDLIGVKAALSRGFLKAFYKYQSRLPIPVDLVVAYHSNTSTQQDASLFSAQFRYDTSEGADSIHASQMHSRFVEISFAHFSNERAIPRGKHFGLVQNVFENDALSLTQTRASFRAAHQLQCMDTFPTGRCETKQCLQANITHRWIW